MAQDDRLIHIQPDRCRDEFDKKVALQPFGINESLKSGVRIDLFTTDQQIKKDFSDWLASSRKIIDIRPQKKLITQINFNYWIKYGVIPYLDLVLIAKIEGKKITQNKLAQLIFPNEPDVDIVGRLRQVTKPEAERLIENQIHKTLSTQMSAKKSGMKSA